MSTYLPSSKEETKFIPRNLSWKLRFKKTWNLYHKFLPILYLSCLLFGGFVYISKKTNGIHSNDLSIDNFQFDDTYQSNNDQLDLDQQALTNLKKPTIFEEFPYESKDLTMLPIAPYEHLQDKLDFRSTMTFYLEVIKNYVAKSTSGSNSQPPPTFSFNWKDFVDLNILKPLLQEKPNCFRIGALGATSRIPWENCLDEPRNLGFVFINPSLYPESEFRLSIRGKSYLYTAAPLPNKLIFLAGELAFVTRVNKRASLDEGTMIDEYLQRKLKENPGSTQEKIIRTPINPSDEIDGISQALKRDLINFNVEKSLHVNVDDNSFSLPTTKENKEKSMLANAARHNDDRHFRNVLIKSKDGQWESEEQYDWRFFNKKLNNLNKKKSLHSIVENYLQFCTNLGITTWLSEESLTSWNYNGLIGPWEDTIRFELPASDVSRIANSFNYSLIISDPKNGTGNYLIDISPWFLERARYNDGGAAPDPADGRIIDTHTGVYIELIGVINAPRIPKDFAAQHKSEKVSEYVVTGRGNFWHLPSLLPLNKTLYEGKIANVPKTIPEQYLEPPIEYHYKDHLRLFVDSKKCTYVPEEEKNKFDQTYIGCCHDDLIWKDYNSTKFATQKFLQIKGQPINVLDETDINF
ncbi:hypothetical protein BN7_3891 [Wickerhamomyces ciferrii]|uniref:LicD/FKTN/FKRP nucleotidyltransferase domain-containing protein n=1 Tax=Wickerhamomyces ciferrii (strain ATCC 14091 / BCRC 22168 / CBS 111 / JCM 3599 / NBRC 0793 / NRRL Y-1031 F-60-10) TaxID=1206466 RepID=K0KSK9_WICCF|nr:uncharacterized protein BN7_3891 [Wickerhamomyces ciferrii]CCH44329.1 hypothetical protein BN7_3891 [Wickerhamomyces ciferrii]